jgi:hypothetical protein
MDKEESVQDETFRNLFLDTKINADENLKYRVIHQIEIEKVFLKEKGKIKNVTPLIDNLKSVFCVMYAFIAFITVGFCFIEGKNMLLTSSFLRLILLVVTISVFFSLISIIDESRRSES